MKDFALEKMPMKFLDRLDPFALAAFLVPLAVYLVTLAPSVTFFDSGEFAVAAWSLGSAHSPGYPTFLNFAKPFTWIPIGNIAFRVNFATAFSAALAVFGVYLLAAHILKNEEFCADQPLSRLASRAIPLAGALSFAFTPRLWLQSNHDKPYPLVAFFAALIFYLLFLWRDGVRSGEGDRPGLIYAATFLAGLSFGAHQTTILLVPSFAYLVLSADWRFLFRLREWILGVFFAVLGFAAHLHLPLRASRDPLLNWADPDSLSRFLWHFLRKGYPVDKPARDIQLLWDQIQAFHLSWEFTWVGVNFIFLGMVFFFRKRRDEIIAYLVGIAAFLLMIAGYLNTPAETIFLTEEFFTPLYMYSGFFISLGMFSVLRKAFSTISAEKIRSLPAMASAGVVTFALPLFLCGANFYENDQHANYVAFNYAQNSLRSLDEGAVLFTWGDSGAFPLWYVQGVEKMREDASLVHTPHLVFDWYLDTFPQLYGNSVLRRVPMEARAPEYILTLAIAEQMGKRPVFIDFSTRYSVVTDSYFLHQRGISYQLLPLQAAAPTPDLDIWDRYALRGVGTGDMGFRDLDTGKALMIYGYAGIEFAETLSKNGLNGLALTYIRKSVDFSPTVRPQAEELAAKLGFRL